MGYVVEKTLDANRSLVENFRVKEDAQGHAPEIPADYDIFIANTDGKPNHTVMQRSEVIYSFDAATLAVFSRSSGYCHVRGTT